MKPFDTLLAIPVGGLNALGVLMVVGMVASTGSYVYYHMSSRTDEVTLARSSYSDSMTELKSQAVSGMQLREQVELIQARVSEQPQLHRSTEYNNRSANIAASAEMSGIRIDNLQPEEQVTEGRVSWIPIICTGEGSVDSLMEWIDQMEQEWPDIVVQSIRVDSGEPGDQFRLNLLFRWYVLVEQSG
jgi:Tfp pilus assembly protein PilO